MFRMESPSQGSFLLDTFAGEGPPTVKIDLPREKVCQ